MKKMIAMLLALTLVFGLAACGGNNVPATEAPTEAPTEAAKHVEGTMEELVNKVMEKQPVEFMGGLMPVDLSDTSEDGLWAIKSFTGLDSAEQISDVAVFEPMMGSIPFSLVMVRANEGADVKAVAEGMKTNIDQRKWICVEADDLQVVSFGDVVMLIMVGSDTGMTSQAYVDAFAEVCGDEVTVH